MRKRVTFLQRRSDLTADEFRQHWRTTHGPIAAAFAGLERYVQNNVHADPIGMPAGIWSVDGIVELWFNDEAGSEPGRDPEVTSLLTADEPTFLSGLTGFAVPPCDPYDPVTWKVWVLGRWLSGSADPSALATFAEALESECGNLRLLQTHAVSDEVPPFTRAALAPYAFPPRAIALLEWREGKPEDLAIDAVKVAARELAKDLLQPAQVIITESVTIV